MASGPDLSAMSSDSEDTSDISNSSPGTSEEAVSSGEDDRDGTGSHPPVKAKKRARRSQNWAKSVRKRRRNTGKRYVSDTTKKMVNIDGNGLYSLAACGVRCFFAHAIYYMARARLGAAL